MCFCPCAVQFGTVTPVLFRGIRFVGARPGLFPRDRFRPGVEPVFVPGVSNAGLQTPGPYQGLMQRMRLHW